MSEESKSFQDISNAMLSAIKNAEKRMQEQLELMRTRRSEEMVFYNPDPYSRSKEYAPSPYYERAYRPDFGVQHQRGLIVCPVCGEHHCGWWENQILRNNAGEILKDMLNGVFQGEQYYERGGGANEQERYYQRRREEYYARQQAEQFYRTQQAPYTVPTPPPVKTEDVDHDVVSTDIKGKPKKQLTNGKSK
jgi:DNA-directed RNA polymerase subunit M/transcription elongation factor TFIIS